MFTEKYIQQFAKDIAEATEALSHPLPEVIRRGIEAELKTLRRMNIVLTGVSQTSQLHSLRARLRYARIRLNAEKDLKEKKKIETEIADIQATISRRKAPPD